MERWRKEGHTVMGWGVSLLRSLSAYQIFVWPSVGIYLLSVCFAYLSLSKLDSHNVTNE